MSSIRGADKIGVMAFNCLTDAFVQFLGVRDFRVEKLRKALTHDITLRDEGIYFALVAMIVYIGYSGNIKYRVQHHKDQVRFSQQDDRWAEKKHFYNLAKEVTAEAEFGYAAVNKYQTDGDGLLLEALESLLISICQTFLHGSRGPD